MATLREKSDDSPRSVKHEGEAKTGSDGKVRKSLLHLPDDEINAILDRTLITMSPDAFDEFLKRLDAPPCPEKVARVRARFARLPKWDD